MVVRKIIESVLVAGSTTVTFTDSEIPNSLIRLYSTDEDLLPESQSVTGTTLTVTYPMQTSNKPVALEIVKAGLSIFDNLTSDDTAAALSAKQGKVLKGLIDDIVVPIVNDGTLTIQKNGSDIQTFTANSAADKTVNITVPTHLSDLTDDILYRYTLLDQIAPINDNTAGIIPDIAEENYSAGDLFIQQKKLCKAITDIAQFDALVKNTNYIEVTVSDEIALKADISAIGTDESGRTTASREYAYGERFYKDGKFCRTRTAVASGATWTLNTNYEEGDIADWLEYYATQVTPSTGVTFDRNHVSVFGKTVNVYLKMTTFADSSTFAHQLGNLTTLRPAAEYAFLTIASIADPYDTLGHVFITGTDGRVGLPRGLPNSTDVFIHGTYITKD